MSLCCVVERGTLVQSNKLTNENQVGETSSGVFSVMSYEQYGEIALAVERIT